MSARPLSILALTSAALLGGCSFIDQVRMTVAEYAGHAVVAECALSTTQRSVNLAAINGWLATANHTPRVIAIDCDGDGQPDF